MHHQMRTRALLVLAALLAAACSSDKETNDSTPGSSGDSSADSAPVSLSLEDLIEGADVRFSEIHFHPAADVEADEFLELVNAGNRSEERRVGKEC